MILIVIPLPQNQEKSDKKKEKSMTSSYSSSPNEYEKAETLPSTLKISLFVNFEFSKSCYFFIVNILLDFFSISALVTR